MWQMVQVVTAALAMWGYNGDLTIHGMQVQGTVGYPPEHFPEWAIAWGYPDGGTCYIGFHADHWFEWTNEMRVRAAAHEIGHCLLVPHNDNPNSLMTSGIGTTILPEDWAAAQASRPPLGHRTLLPHIASY